MAIKFCNQCKQPFQEGYYFENLDVEYFCSDECLTTAYPDLDEEKREEMYDEDSFYYSEWHSLEPKLNLIQVYTHPNTVNLWINQEDAHQNWFFAGKMHESVESKWILITEQEENDLLHLIKEEEHTKIYNFTQNPFIHTPNRTFETLELAKSAYLEEEEAIWD